MKKYKGKFPNLEELSGWNFSYLPYIEPPKPPKQTMEFKIEFCNKLLYRIMTHYESKMIEYSNEKKYDEAEKLYEKLKFSGIRNYQLYKVKSFIYTSRGDNINATKFNNKAEKYKQLIVINDDNPENYKTIDKILPSSESKSESKSETKSESKSETKSESKSEIKSESKSESKSEIKSESKSEIKSETKSESKPEVLNITKQLDKKMKKNKKKKNITTNENKNEYMQPFNNTNYIQIFKLNDKITYCNIDNNIPIFKKNEMINLMGKFMVEKIISVI